MTYPQIWYERLPEDTVSDAADTEASVVLVLLGVKQTPDPDQSGKGVQNPTQRYPTWLSAKVLISALNFFQFIFLAAILLSYLLLIIYNTY